MDLTLIEPWAARHHGLITRAAAAEAGVSKASWYRALAAVRLEMVQPGVARLWGTPRTREQRIEAAVLSIGTGAIASHRSAAFLWGVTRPNRDPVDLVVAPDRRVPELVGVEVHRPADRSDLTSTVRDGIAVTNPLRMLCDLAAVDRRGVAAAVEHVVIAGLVLPTGLRALVERRARPDHRGMDALREVVTAWPLGAKPADEVLEPALTKLLAEHGLPPAEFHPNIAGVEVDFRIIGTPVVVQCNGWEFSVTSRAQFQLDRERDAALAAAGYRVVRLTWEHITRRADATAARLEAVIRRWSPDALDGPSIGLDRLPVPVTPRRRDACRRRSA